MFGLSKKTVKAGDVARALALHVPKLEIQAEIAARIYTSDALIAPSRTGVTRSDWVSWEVQLAAVGYGLPILFVRERNHQRQTRWVREIAELGLPHAVCARASHEIVANLIQLLDGRPNWGVRQEETDANIRFRGPPASARGDVLKRFPFRPKLPPLQLEPAPKRGFWSFLSGEQRG